MWPCKRIQSFKPLYNQIFENLEFYFDVCLEGGIRFSFEGKQVEAFFKKFLL